MPGICLDDFTMLKVIGKGSFAKVVLVKKKDNGKVYALKILKKKYIQKKRQQQHVMIERNILIQVEHQFLIKLYYSFTNQTKLFFALEYCPGGELFGLLEKKKKLSEQQTRFYVSQMILALQYLHSKNIIYREYFSFISLKPENVLIDSEGYIKLADFGLAKMKIQNPKDAFSVSGTPQYLSPQILYKQGHGKAVDWWCLGSIIYQMITGIPAFYSKNRNELFDKIKFNQPNYPTFVIQFKQISKILKNLLERLFQKIPQNRLGFNGAYQIKNHEWFEKIKWQSIKKKQYKAPFIPKILSQCDVSNFSSQFTQSEIFSYTQNIKQDCKQFQSNF